LGALVTNITGTNNTANGAYALDETTGNYNTALGYDAGYNATGTGGVYIGANAGYNDTNSNVFYVNNVQEGSIGQDRAYSLLYGIFSGSAGSLTGQQLTINGNVGIGTYTPQSGFVVTNGNVGIGTWTSGSALNVVGNVDIGSIAPNGALDVGAGSICLGHTCYSNWTSSGTNYWVNDLAGNVGISTIYAVGIGTTFVGGTGEASLAVMNGNVGIGTWTPSSTLNINGSMAISTVSITSVASPYTVTASNGVILVNASGGAITINLPASSGAFGREYIIKRTDATITNAVNITANGTDTIDGQATVSLTAQYQSFTIISDGAGHWYII